MLNDKYVRLKRLNDFLFDLIQSTIFQLCRDGSSWVEPELSKDNVFCSMTHYSDAGEAQTAAPRSRVKLSTTEPLCSLKGLTVNFYC